ncbi:MAG TPA: hypothetical protein VN969_28665 [Streptosporangiaceae bacterium]|nr:hypothetical protein [Streptosporangiaceae bacterium]
MSGLMAVFRQHGMFAVDVLHPDYRTDIPGLRDRLVDIGRITIPPDGQLSADDFGGAFTALLDAAGLNPDRLLRALDRQHQSRIVTRATLYDWKNGKHLPEDSAVFRVVVGICLRYARERGSPVPLAEEQEWLALLAAARRSRDFHDHLAHSRGSANRVSVFGSADRTIPSLAVPAESGSSEGLYRDALGQLGSEVAIVRIGGLHALSRIGQDNPHLRESIIDVICAYLRMPYPATVRSPGSDSAGKTREQGELQVRLTAQRMLTRHLRDEGYLRQRHDGSTEDTFWPGMDVINLTGAHLVNLNLSHCRFRAIECNGASLVGETLFRALLCDLGFFQKAIFDGHADFRGASFDDAWFSYAKFTSEPWFQGDEFYRPASFESHADFRNVIFTRGARFDRATFGGSAEFGEVSCEAGARAISLQGARVLCPDARGPEFTHTPSRWPEGWRLQASKDGISTLNWHG